MMNHSSDSAAGSFRISTPNQNRMRKNLLLHLIMIMTMIMNVDLCLAVEYVVGDDRGWDRQSDFHGWASRRSFHVGDNLWFAYSSGEQSVIELKSKEKWEACNTSNPIKVYNGGVDSVPLVQVGTRYFSSRRAEDCQNGMKLRINVDAAPSSSSSSKSQTRSKTDDGILGNLISREDLQKIREWYLPWSEIEEFSTLTSRVKDVAEAPTSGSPPTFSTRSIFSSLLLNCFSFCCINILITSFYGCYML